MILVHLYRYTTFVMEDSHMGQISQPQHKNAAAGENRDIGPFIEAVNFDRTQQMNIEIFGGVLDPSNLKFSVQENFIL